METPTPDLIKSVMAELGRRGGKSTSSAKKQAAKRNLAKAHRIRKALNKVKRSGKRKVQ